VKVRTGKKTTPKIKRNGAEQVLKGKINLPEEKAALTQPTLKKTLEKPGKNCNQTRNPNLEID
jgi:hypothetical protein